MGEAGANDRTIIKMLHPASLDSLDSLGSLGSLGSLDS
jgi:hypothetical protein